MGRPDLIGAAAGIALAVATEATLRPLSERRRRQMYAMYLPVAAAIYPAARRRGYVSPEGRRELVALAAYSAVAAAARDNRMLAAGWAGHAVFDMVHHGGGADSRIPEWYPAACAGYDLLVAAFLLNRG